MHAIEPFFRWRDDYTAETDERSPFFGRDYSEFYFENTIYNYYIHPQWDEFGSATLYVKILYADYEERFAILELIGEWNDTIYDDIMVLKRKLVDVLLGNGIAKFVVIGENVLNFHGGDDDYYNEWLEDVMDADGWICFVNFQPHVREEMAAHRLYQYLHFDAPFDDVAWRTFKPEHIALLIEKMLRQQGRISA